MKKWYKDKDGAMVSGVLSGLSIYLGIDKTVVRLVFLLTMTFTFTIIPYILMSIILPVANDMIIDNENKQRSKHLRRSLYNRKIAGVCSGIENRFLIDVSIVRFIFLLFLPTSITVYIIMILLMPNEYQN